MWLARRCGSCVCRRLRRELFCSVLRATFALAIARRFSCLSVSFEEKPTRSDSPRRSERDEREDSEDLDEIDPVDTPRESCLGRGDLGDPCPGAGVFCTLATPEFFGLSSRARVRSVTSVVWPVVPRGACSGAVDGRLAGDGDRRFVFGDAGRDRGLLLDSSPRDIRRPVPALDGRLP